MTIYTNKFSLIATAESTQDVEVFTKRYINFITDLLNVAAREGFLPRRLPNEASAHLMDAPIATENRLIERLGGAITVTNDISFVDASPLKDEIDFDSVIIEIEEIFTGIHNTPLEVLRNTKSMGIHITANPKDGAHGYPLVQGCVLPKGRVPIILYVKIQCTEHSNVHHKLPDNVVSLIK